MKYALFVAGHGIEWDWGERPFEHHHATGAATSKVTALSYPLRAHSVTIVTVASPDRLQAHGEPLAREFA